MPVLQCCRYASRFIVLNFESYRGDSPDFFKKNRPFWMVRGTTLEEPFGMDSCERLILFCPSCGKKLPDIRLREKPPEKVTVIIDGGNYCETCQERLRNCQCERPEELWEIVEELRDA